jgi:hypothetical protein
MKKILIAAIIVMGIVGASQATSPLINSMSSLPINGVYYTQAPTLTALPAATWIDSVVLAANTAATYTIPTGAKYLLFSANGVFYVNYNSLATIPTITNASGSSVEIGPMLRGVTGLTSISLIAPAATIISISVYK